MGKNAYPSYALAGDETIRSANLDAGQGRFSFNLPGLRPQGRLDASEGPAVLDMVLHTVVIYKPTNQMTLVWRGSIAYGGLKAMETSAKLEYAIRPGPTRAGL